MKELAKRAQHLATSKNVAKILKLDHLATGWPNACNTLRATMLQDVALKCCVRLVGPYTLQ